jgi:hypothetical protein
MKIVILLEERLLPIPGNLKTEENWGSIAIAADGCAVVGDHVCLSGDKDVFVEWLRPFDHIWVGKGPPQLQDFDACHIR